jgi:hypothetical protein
VISYVKKTPLLCLFRVYVNDVRPWLFRFQIGAVNDHAPLLIDLQIPSRSGACLFFINLTHSVQIQRESIGDLAMSLNTEGKCVYARHQNFPFGTDVILPEVLN